MSANLDLVRSIYKTWERGDFSSAEWADPNISLVFADGPDPGSWRGLAGMSDGFRSMFTAWEDVSATAEEYRELDGERVLVLDHRSGHGKTSGLQLGQLATEGGTLWQTRRGRVINLTIYWDRERALADLGLKE